MREKCSRKLDLREQVQLHTQVHGEENMSRRKLLMGNRRESERIRNDFMSRRNKSLPLDAWKCIPGGKIYTGHLLLDKHASRTRNALFLCTLIRLSCSSMSSPSSSSELKVADPISFLPLSLPERLFDVRDVISSCSFHPFCNHMMCITLSIKSSLSLQSQRELDQNKCNSEEEYKSKGQYPCLLSWLIQHALYS